MSVSSSVSGSGQRCPVTTRPSGTTKLSWTSRRRMSSVYLVRGGDTVTLWHCHCQEMSADPRWRSERCWRGGKPIFYPHLTAYLNSGYYTITAPRQGFMWLLVVRSLRLHDSHLSPLLSFVEKISSFLALVTTRSEFYQMMHQMTSSALSSVSSLTFPTVHFLYFSILLDHQGSWSTIIQSWETEELIRVSFWSGPGRVFYG